MATIQSKIGRAKTGEEILIRSAQVEDALPALKCMRTAAATTEQILTCVDEFPTSLQEEESFIISRRDDPSSLFLLAIVDDRIVGAIGFDGPKRRRAAHTGTIGMTLSQDWRGRGAGTFMLETVLDWATKHPVIEKVCLSVFSSNDAGMALYRKLNFIEEGRRPGQIRLSNGYVDEIFMARWVKPRQLSEQRD